MFGDVFRARDIYYENPEKAIPAIAILPSFSKADPVKTFADRLVVALKHYEIRRSADVSWTKFGEIVGKRMNRDRIPPATVSAWKTGKQLPSPGEVAVIAKVLGVRAGWLLFGEEPMIAEPHANPGHTSNPGPRVRAEDVSFGGGVDVPIPPRHEPRRHRRKG
jgi:hypothetical protein